MCSVKTFAYSSKRCDLCLKYAWKSLYIESEEPEVLILLHLSKHFVAQDSQGRILRLVIFRFPIKWRRRSSLPPRAAVTEAERLGRRPTLQMATGRTRGRLWSARCGQACRGRRLNRREFSSAAKYLTVSPTSCA